MLCRAKINLTLHVGAPIASGQWAGYHPVESLVAFASIGDRLSATPSDQNSLTIKGPFRDGLDAGPDNLVLRAMAACNAEPHRITLSKHLPVASGLGGGSANAAGILRRFDSLGQVDAVSLGADVPVCRLSATAMMEGIGEQVTPLFGLGRVAALLVNPGVPVSTGTIFKRYDALDPPAEPNRTQRTGSLLHRARSGTNDLQAPAIAEAQIISEVIAALELSSGCDLARMSGSGATCFGLFGSMEAAEAAAESLSDRGWWLMPAWLGEAA